MAAKSLEDLLQKSRRGKIMHWPAIALCPSWNQIAFASGSGDGVGREIGPCAFT